MQRLVPGAKLVLILRTGGDGIALGYGCTPQVSGERIDSITPGKNRATQPVPGDLAAMLKDCYPARL